jgi:hypothetical protein
VGEEFPAMADRSEDLMAKRPALLELIEVNGPLQGRDPSQEMAIAAVNDALEARHERILISQRSLGTLKIAVVVCLAFMVLIVLAVVHFQNRKAQRVAVFLFAAAAAVSTFVVVIYDQPFSHGGYVVAPEPLLEVMPQ